MGLGFRISAWNFVGSQNGPCVRKAIAIIETSMVHMQDGGFARICRVPIFLSTRIPEGPST